MAILNPEWEILLRDWDIANDKALSWLASSWKKKEEDKEIAILMYKKFKKETQVIAFKMNEVTFKNKIIL